MSNQAYPLCWPAGWPRTTTRESGRFKTTLSAALNFLRKEVGLLGGKNLVLSSNCTLGHERPVDSGVVAYFLLKDQNIAIPCDRWRKVEDNVRAIGLTIEAMRGMERWGAKHMIKAMFQGFKALPAQTGEAFNCWTVLAVEYHDKNQAPFQRVRMPSRPHSRWDIRSKPRRMASHRSFARAKAGSHCRRRNESADQGRATHSDNSQFAPQRRGSDGDQRVASPAYG